MRKTALSFLLLFFTFHFSFSHDSVAFHYASQITTEGVKPHLEVLASDSLEGRETGKPGQKKAARFIANHFQSLGLKPISHETYLQDFNLLSSVGRARYFVANEQLYLYMRDVYYLSGFEDTIVNLDTIVFAGFGLSRSNHNDYSDLPVKDKAAVIIEGLPKIKGEVEKKEDWKITLKEKLSAAATHGVSLLLIVTDSLEQRIDELNYGRYSLKDFSPKKGVPFVLITPDVADALFLETNQVRFQNAVRKIRKKNVVKSFVSSTSAQLGFAEDVETLKGQNVIGLLEGTDKKEETIIITAHYDHLGKRDSVIYYGADDDASGTSAVMEFARCFSKAAAEGHRPRRSILFMATAGEEKGLLGSKYYVSHPLVPLESTVANLNIDMIGRIDIKHDSLGMRNYVYVIGANKMSTELHRINEHADSVFTHLDLDYTYNHPDDPNRFYSRSDHYNFAKKNIPIIFYFNGVHKDYHKPTDTKDKIQYDILVKRAQLVFLTAWELANREDRIKVDVKNDMKDRRE